MPAGYANAAVQIFSRKAAPTKPIANPTAATTLRGRQVLAEGEHEHTHELRVGCAFLTRQVAAKYDLYAMASKVENMAVKIVQINSMLTRVEGRTHLQCKYKVKVCELCEFI